MLEASQDLKTVNRFTQSVCVLKADYLRTDNFTAANSRFVTSEASLSAKEKLDKVVTSELMDGVWHRANLNHLLIQLHTSKSRIGFYEEHIVPWKQRTAALRGTPE